MKKSTRLWLLALALALACACLPLAAFAAGTQSAAQSGLEAGGYAFAATKATSLATPKITKAESTASGVKLTWGRVAGAAKYRVFYKKGGKWTKLADTTSTSYTWKKAKNGAKYTFTVRCLSKDGKKYTSGYNKTGKSITYKKPASTLATPKLSKVENVAGGVKVTWGKVSGAAKYRVFYKTGSGSWKKAGDTTGTSYTWKKAKSGTKYTFTVRCLSKDGKKYTSGYNKTGKAITCIAAPTITKLENTASGVKVTWGKVAGAAKYRVFYKKGGKWTKLADTTSTSYTWKGAKSGTKYTFTVRCLSKDAKSYTSAYNTAGKSITYKKPVSISGSVAINAANFPDEIFRSYVSENFDKDKNGTLSAAERKAVTSVKVDFMDISTLKGIESFAAMNTLSCAGNRLKALDVSKNPALKTLECSYNQLTALDVRKNTGLLTLYCSDNQLKTLDVSKNTSLKELECSYNRLTALDVKGASALQTLFCRFNSLKNLDVSKNTALQTLYCGTNQLTKLDVGKNTKLQGLYCTSNQLAALDVGKNTALKDLECDRNALKVLNTSKNPALVKLICDHNQLATLDVRRNGALKELNCGYNQLAALDVSKNAELEYLNCEKNPLTRLDVRKNKKLTALYYDSDVTVIKK